MKKLLAIIDKPKESKKFIKYVSNLASDLHAQVHLLHVRSPESYPLGIASTGGIVASQIKKSLDKDVQVAKNTIDQHLEDLKNEVPDTIFMGKIVKVGSTITAVKEFIKEHDTNMVILESKGSEDSWIEVANNMEIIEGVDCPVWVVPKNVEYKPFKVIIYTTDYLEADVPTLKKLVHLTTNYLPKIIALHITESLDFEEIIKKTGFMDTVRKATAYNNIDVEAINVFDNMSITEVINDYISQVKGDLVVVLKENQNFLQRIFKTHPAEKIIKKSNSPVLIYHENN